MQGWIDCNGNDTFETGEQIATDLQDDGTGDDTAADDGEVEDYAVTILDSPVCP